MSERIEGVPLGARCLLEMVQALQDLAGKEAAGKLMVRRKTTASLMLWGPGTCIRKHVMPVRKMPGGTCCKTHHDACCTPGGLWVVQNGTDGAGGGASG